MSDRYLSVNEIQLIYDLLCENNPDIVNDVQNFIELLVDIYEGDGIKVGYNEVRMAFRSL